MPELQGHSIGAQTTDQIEKRLADLLKSPRKHAIDYRFEEGMLARKEPYAFVAPTKPPVVVTDMRTYRKFGRFRRIPHLLEPTSLLNDNAYKHLAEICKELPPNKPIVLVSGTPLFNWYPLTFGRNLGISKKELTTSRAADLSEFEVGDLWDDHSKGRARFIQWIHDTLKPSYCVIFSGDVHHGSVIKGKATMRVTKDAEDLWSLDIVNITSSPMKNEAPKLTDKLMGTPKGGLYDISVGTSNEEEIVFSENNGWMRISYDAVKLHGRLVFMGRPIPSYYPGLIFLNHFCVVDFSKPKMVATTFFGFGATNCSAMVNV